MSEDDTGYSYLEYMSNMNYAILVDVGCVGLMFLVKGAYFLVNRKLNSVNEHIAKMIAQEEERVKENAEEEGAKIKK